MAKTISMGIKRQPQEKIEGRMESFLSAAHHFQARQVDQHQVWGTTSINHANPSLFTKSITPDRFFTLSQVNIRSIRNKIGQFQQHLTESSTDICILLETRMKDSDQEKPLLHQIPPSSYNSISYPRKPGRGGETAIIQRELVRQ